MKNAGLLSSGEVDGEKNEIIVYQPEGGRISHRSSRGSGYRLADAGAKSCKTSIAKSSLLDFMTELQPIAHSANGGAVQYGLNFNKSAYSQHFFRCWNCMGIQLV